MLVAYGNNPSDPYEGYYVPFVSGAGTALGANGDPIESVIDTGATPIVGQESIIDVASGSSSIFIGMDLPYNLF